MSLTVTGDAFSISKSFIYRRTETNADVFNRMMMVYLDVATRRYVQVHKAVGCQEEQHMVHKRDLSIYSATSGSIDVQRDCYVGFRGFSFNFGFTVHQSIPENFEQEVVRGRIRFAPRELRRGGLRSSRKYILYWRAEPKLERFIWWWL
jgi:hypothetical protein